MLRVAVCVTSICSRWGGVRNTGEVKGGGRGAEGSEASYKLNLSKNQGITNRGGMGAIPWGERPFK